MSLFGKKDSVKENAHKRYTDIPEGEFPDEPLVVDSSDIDAVLNRFPNVVVDCWAPWCRPCLAIAPTIEAMAKDYKGKIVFVKMNTDENQKFAMKHKIMNIPTLMIFKNGKAADRVIGARPRKSLEKMIFEALGL